MSSLLRGACALAIVVLLEGCSGRGPGPLVEHEDESDVVQGVALRISVADDACGIASAEVFVAGDDMLDLGPVALTLKDGVLSGQVANVPAGVGRRIHVTAYNASRIPVYRGSAVVDVTRDAVVTADVVLQRDPTTCVPGTAQDAGAGGIAVTGTLEPVPKDLSIFKGPELGFAATGVHLAGNGILHFWSVEKRTLRRLDLTTGNFRPALVGSADATSIAVARDGSEAYMAYLGGRIDAFDLSTDSARFFGAAPASVTKMLVVDGFLLVNEGPSNPYSWSSTYATFRRADGARVSSLGSRDAPSDWVFSMRTARAYVASSNYLQSYGIDLTTGALTQAETTSYASAPYFSPPVRLSTDGSAVVVGSGHFFDGTSLAYRRSFGLTFVDMATADGRYFLLDNDGGQSRLRVLNERLEILSTQHFPGGAHRVFHRDGKVVLVTSFAAPTATEVRIFTP